MISKDKMFLKNWASIKTLFFYDAVKRDPFILLFPKNMIRFNERAHLKRSSTPLTSEVLELKGSHKARFWAHFY